jgi:hypothetical protein
MLCLKSLCPILISALWLGGCAIAPSNETVSDVKKKINTLNEENETLRSSLVYHQEWKKELLQQEDRISRLEAILEPLAPLKQKNMELMATNARENEEVGGGALSEIFYLVQTAYSELDLQAANLASDINTSFLQDDFVQVYLYGLLEDKVVELSIEIAEIVNRRSSHMATDRRIVTARVKALNECFQAIRHLSENKDFELSYQQRTLLLEKADDIRVEYAKTLKTDYFPAIPHFLPMVSGEDYLKVLNNMNQHIHLQSSFFINDNAANSKLIFEQLSKDLEKKRTVLKEIQ